MTKYSYIFYTTAYVLLGYIITYEQLFIYSFLKKFMPNFTVFIYQKSTVKTF